MIILEGPDGSGKTTLAHRIADEWGLEYRRPPTLSSTRGPDMAVYEWWQEQLRLDEDAVYDRCFFISEFIYQLAMPARSLMVEGEVLGEGIVDLINCEPFFIFCLPPWEKTRPVVLSGRDRLEGYEEDALLKIHWGYHVLYALYWSAAAMKTIFKWDYTDPDADHRRERLLISVGTYIKGRELV